MTKLSAVFNCKVLSFFSPKNIHNVYPLWHYVSKAVQSHWPSEMRMLPSMNQRWNGDSLLPNGNFISISIPLRIKKLMATVDYFPLASDFSSFLPSFPEGASKIRFLSLVSSSALKIFLGFNPPTKERNKLAKTIHRV